LVEVYWDFAVGDDGAGTVCDTVGVIFKNALNPTYECSFSCTRDN
jgi:hypothetical protein